MTDRLPTCSIVPFPERLAGGLSVALLAAGAIAAGAAQAQAWPAKPIRMIVNFGAGGSTDVIARSMAPRLGEALGQQVVVENRVGAGGNIGLDVVARAAPDGYTLLHSSDGTILINPFLYDMPSDPAKDLVAIAPTGRAAIFLVARAGLPVKTLPEFIAYARANPGKLNYGSAGNGTLQHVATEMLAREAKINVVHVAYKGSQQVMIDLLGGQVDFTFDLGAAIEHIKADKVRLLAVPTATRSPIFPNAPTMIEAGTNMTIAWLSGVYAPAATPRDVVLRLNREINRIMQTPEARATLSSMAAEPATPATPEEFAASQQKARERFGTLVKEANIRVK
ncbi:MAG: Bug family tripartite tricarboxylate transporter substrate binding protein [bacterium]|jgi:tripartite-type tricarboxylate transporter receptor subunit TctC|nr:tripartite tricarboxylate transporter substrate binding protein [Betaproteobacteria bacterium]